MQHDASLLLAIIEDRDKAKLRTKRVEILAYGRHLGVVGVLELRYRRLADSQLPRYISLRPFERPAQLEQSDLGKCLVAQRSKPLESTRAR